MFIFFIWYTLFILFPSIIIFNENEKLENSFFHGHWGLMVSVLFIFLIENQWASKQMDSNILTWNTQNKTETKIRFKNLKSIFTEKMENDENDENCIQQTTKLFSHFEKKVKSCCSKEKNYLNFLVRVFQLK